MVLTKTVKMKPSGKSISYYKNKGYNAVWHQELEVNVSDLSDNSGIIIEAQCDYENCKCIEKIRYSKYTKNLKENNGFFYCKNCWSKRLPLKIQELYGVDNISKLENIKDKKCQTLLKNYGAKYPLQSPEIRERIRNTCNQKYGTTNIAELDAVKEKRKKTNFEKYGHEEIARSPVIRAKAKQTNMERYGYEYISQVPDIAKRIKETFYKNQTVATSTQQKYIYQLYGGELNGVVSHYNCDIVFRDEKLIFEYDGGGHLLGVKIGTNSIEESRQRELIRDKLIKSEGYRIVRIISRKDYLPSDTTLLQMLQYARDFFAQNPKRTWLSFDIDNSCIYNAYHKETDVDNIQYYNYGKLHKLNRNIKALI